MPIYTYSDLITKTISETNPNMQCNTLQRTLKCGGCHLCRVGLRFLYITLAQNGLVTYFGPMVFFTCGLNLSNFFFQYERPIKNYTNSAIRKTRNRNRILRLNKLFHFFRPVADPGFQGVPTPEADAPFYYFTIFFAEN